MADRNEYEPLNRAAAKPIEPLLRQLRPRASTVDRDRLMFLAGQAAASPAASPIRRWIWPAATAVATCAALVLAVLLLIRPEPQVIREIVYVPQPVSGATQNVVATSHPQPDRPPERAADAAPQPEPPPYRRADPSALVADNYLALRDLALAHGVDALPRFTGDGGGTTAPATSRELLESLLNGSGPNTSPAPPRPLSLFQWPFFNL